jgi:tRNA(Ile)-lysidine synthase
VDSTFLAVFLKEQFARSGHRLALAHVNHRTRGAESDEDEAFVEALAEKLGVPFFVGRLEEGAGLDEGALRAGRLSLLKQMAEQNGAAAIAFAHQRDDLAETFLLMALRGSGPAGLEGMRPVRRTGGLLLIRPLLSMTRAEIEDELAAREQNWRNDRTNDEVHFRRNFLRHRVIPLLNEIEPAAVRKLAESAAICGEMRDAEEAHLAPLLKEIVLHQGDDHLLFDARRLREAVEAAALPGAVRSLLARMTRTMELDAPLTFSRAVLQSIVERLAAPGDEAFFGNNPWLWLSNRFGLISFIDDLGRAFWHARPGFPFLIISEEEAQEVEESLLPTRTGTSVLVGERMVNLRVLDRDSAPVEEESAAVGIDWLQVRGSLRFTMAGEEERINFAGGSKTVRDCLKEAGVPTLLRAQIAALRDEEGILWIPGVRQDARSLVTERTTQVLQCRLVEP